MSKKFLRVLGICVLIIMLPVFITVAAVCLAEDGNGGSGNGNTFVVSSEYGSSTKVQLDANGDWKIAEVPTRDYYLFTGISVNEVTYTVESGLVMFTEEATQADFEKAVKTDKKEITAVWSCVYNQIKIVADSTFDTVDNTAFVETLNINPNLLALETTGVLTKMNYSFEYAVTPLNVIDENAEGSDSIVIDFEETDLNERGDFTVKTLLDKINAKGIELQVAEGNILNLYIY